MSYPDQIHNLFVASQSSSSEHVQNLKTKKTHIDIWVTTVGKK